MRNHSKHFTIRTYALPAGNMFGTYHLLWWDFYTRSSWCWRWLCWCWWHTRRSLICNNENQPKFLFIPCECRIKTMLHCWTAAEEMRWMWWELTCATTFVACFEIAFNCCPELFGNIFMICCWPAKSNKTNTLLSTVYTHRKWSWRRRMKFIVDLRSSLFRSDQNVNLRR